MPKVTGKLKTQHKLNGDLPTAKQTQVKSPEKREPLWEGPEISGITQSLLGKFLNCRERFRLLVVEGLKEEEGFNLKLEYGNMIHTCEEATAAKRDWEAPLLEYARKLVKKYGNNDSAQIDHWYKVCCAEYPVYLNHWKKNPDVKNRKPLFQEKPFDVPYVLPSGRTVRLRGKYDAGDLISGKLYIQENKAKGDVKPDKLLSELPMDLQTNMYLTAANEEFNGVYELGGCRYNVIRRPLSGGKYSIKQLEGRGKEKKGAETEEGYYARLQGLIKADPQHFFFRWKIEIIPSDILKFQVRSLNPVLEQLWDWWTWIKCDPFNPWRTRTIGELLNNSPALPGGKCFTASADMNEPQTNCIHWMHPTGVYNPTAEGKMSIYDECLLTGNMRGLVSTSNLFPELIQ